MAAYDCTTWGAAFEFDTANGEYHSSARIDATHVINFYQGNGVGECVVLEADGSGDLTESDSITFDASNNRDNNCCQIDENHFINFWRGGAGNTGYCQVFEVNLSTYAITAKDSPLNFYSGGIIAWPSSCLIDDTHVMVFWGDSDSDGRCQVMEINDSTWAVTAKGSNVEFDTTAGTNNTCQKIDSTHVIHFWNGGATDRGWAQVVSVDGSYNVSSEDSPFNFESGASAWYQTSATVNSLHFINFWRGVDSDGFTQVFTVDDNDWSISAEGTALEFDTDYAVNNACIALAENHFINCWSNSTDSYAQVFNVNSSTYAVTKVGAAVKTSTVAQPEETISLLDTGQFVICWEGGLSDGYAKTYQVEIPAEGDNMFMLF